MTDVWHILIPDEARMRVLAELIATKVSAGDMITLQGDLGAGKTTFSRYLIRALIGDDDAEVPSPTFTLVQTYATPRFDVRHFDLYRVSDADELHELEFDDDEGAYLTLVEWPDRAEDRLGACRLDIAISEQGDAGADGEGGARHVAIVATPDAAWRLSRMRAAYDFLVDQFDAEGLGRLRLVFLQGDASARGYARAMHGGRKQLLMDMPKLPDGPVIRDGKSYSEIAHLAEDARPFVAIAHDLHEAGLSVPEVYAFDEPRGMALIEDLGPLTFAEAMAQGIPQADLWHAAKDVLVALRGHAPKTIVGKDGAVRHRMPAYDAGVMHSEVALLCDWYWPYVNDEPIGESARTGFEVAWTPLIHSVASGTGKADTPAWVIRDFHSPNLIWMSEREGIARVGVIDFQDAQIGHPAYDLASLSMDARLDVPRSLCDALVDDYCTQVSTQEPDFDEAAFRRAVAILGAQRNTKILGIFARLSMRDGRQEYLRHIPRIKRYLNWCLEHPELAVLQAWYDEILGMAD
jgi:N-acetylmuramate 1-kinase